MQIALSHMPDRMYMQHLRATKKEHLIATEGGVWGVREKQFLLIHPDSGTHNITCRYIPTKKFKT